MKAPSLEQDGPKLDGLHVWRVRKEIQRTVLPREKLKAEKSNLLPPRIIGK